MRRSAALFALFVGMVSACAAPYGDRTTYSPPAARRTPAVEPDRPAGPGAPAAQGPHGAGPAGDEVLGLDRSIRIALERSRDVRIADRRILISEDRTLEAYTGYIPRVDATGRVQARSNEIGGRLAGQEFALGDTDYALLRVSMLVPVYTFGRVESQVAAAELREDEARDLADRTREEVVLAVSLAYFRVLEAQKILEVVEQSIEVMEGQLAISRDFLDEGLVAQNDVLSVAVQYAIREQQRIQAENNVQLARATFNRLLELDVERPTRLEDALVAEPWTGEFTSLLSIALRARPDLRALDRQIEIARAEYRETRAEHFPKVYAYGGYNYTTDSFVLNQDWLEGGFAIDVPLFDGLQTYSRLRQRDEQIAVAIDRRDAVVDNIVLEVKRAHLNMIDASRQIPVARKAVELAEENLRMTQDQYSEGALTSTDVLLEEERLSQARSNLYQALYGYQAARAKLIHSIGEDLPPSSGEPPPDDPTAIFDAYR